MKQDNNPPTEEIYANIDSEREYGNPSSANKRKSAKIFAAVIAMMLVFSTAITARCHIEQATARLERENASLREQTENARRYGEKLEDTYYDGENQPKNEFVYW